MTLRNQISAAAGIPQKRPEAIFRQPVARWITVATQFQSDLELLPPLVKHSTDYLFSLEPVRKLKPFKINALAANELTREKPGNGFHARRQKG